MEEIYIGIFGIMLKLTQREEEVLLLVIKGYTNRQIAETLCISTHTAKVHISSLFQKFEVSNRVELVVKLLILSDSAYQKDIIEKLKSDKSENKTC